MGDFNETYDAIQAMIDDYKVKLIARLNAMFEVEVEDIVTFDIEDGVESGIAFIDGKQYRYKIDDRTKELTEVADAD